METTRQITKLVAALATRAALRALREVVDLAAVVLEDTALARTPVPRARRRVVRVPIGRTRRSSVHAQSPTPEPRTTNYCRKCGESPDSGAHLFDHDYVPPATVTAANPAVTSSWTVADGAAARVR